MLTRCACLCPMAAWTLARAIAFCRSRARRGVLAEIRRVLAYDGRLVSMAPNAHGATLAGILALSRDPRHLVSVSLWRPFSRLNGRFTRSTLTATLEASGFESDISRQR